MTTSKHVVILIHGIGNPKTGWSNIASLNEPNITFIEFRYEDIFDNQWKRRFLSKLLSGAAAFAVFYFGTPRLATVSSQVMRQLEDTIGDIFSYFLNRQVRQAIQTRLATLLKRFPSAILMAHSLGSIVAYETLHNHKTISNQVTLITMGSPLGSPVLATIVKKMLSVPVKNRPSVAGWFNFYSPLDLLSGVIKNLGCRREDQYELKTLHAFHPYLHKAFEVLREKEIL